MNAKQTPVVDPMQERPAEAFPEPRTIPDGWDVSAFLPAEGEPALNADASAELFLSVSGNTYVLTEDA